MSNDVHMMPRSFLIWPFKVMWRFTGFLMRFTGCLLAILIGLILMGLGLVLSSTFFGAVIGIPLFVLGVLLLLRGLF